MRDELTKKQAKLPQRGLANPAHACRNTNKFSEADSFGENF